MKNSVCPECREPIGLGAYFSQLWMTRIDCPSCKQTVKVEGIPLYLGVGLPPAIVLGALGEPLRLEYGFKALAAGFVVLMLAATALFVVGLATWITLVRDDPER